jgi:hypothetical protein
MSLCGLSSDALKKQDCSRKLEMKQNCLKITESTRKINTSKIQILSKYSSLESSKIFEVYITLTNPG